MVSRVTCVGVDETGAGDALVAGTPAGVPAGQSLAEAAAETEVAALPVDSEHTVRPNLSPQLVERGVTRRRPFRNGRERP
jgi:sugar/nucleoside kinase (ribokinase family)